MPPPPAPTTGYNVCIFAYGQTGSGKTHTMSGTDIGEYANHGINFRALDDLFEINRQRHAEVRCVGAECVCVCVCVCARVCCCTPTVAVPCPQRPPCLQRLSRLPVPPAMSRRRRWSTA